MCCMHFSGPTWRRPGHESVLLASRRYDGSTSRKTKGSMADTLQCNLWRRAQTPHRMTHSLHGGDNHGDHNGFTALGKTIGTRKSTPKDSEYVEEHSVLKYLRGKLACYLHDFRRHWFVRLRLPPPNGRHDQLYEHRIRRLMRRVVQRSGCWFGRVVLLCRFRVKTDMKDDKGRSVLMDCDCALIDCLYDFAPGGYKCIFVCQSKTLSKQCANQH